MRTLTIQEHTRARALWRCAALAAVILLGLVAAPVAVAARGGGQTSTTNATMTFGDATTDAIVSDGAGPYDAQMDAWGVTVETGKQRGFVFDFTHVIDETSGTRAPSGEVTDVVTYVRSTGGVGFEFTAAGGRWILEGYDFSVETTDVDADGVVDAYDIADDGSGTYYLSRIRSNGYRRPYQEYVGTYSMPWTATVTAK